MGIFRGTGGTGDSTTDTTVTTVTEKAAEAASSATSAANSATSAANSASSASTSETNAATSESNAANSATASATSATASETAKTASQAAQTAAETAEANAETAEANAVTAKNQAESARDNAQTAQTAAETAETNAETAYADTLAIYGSTTDVQNAVNSASASATTATTKAAEAATSATNAANSATSAGTSETNAASSASQAATSANTAGSHATDAETAKNAAETAQAAAEAAEANINGLYLGSLANDPTLDGNGVAVTTGDLYFNTTENEVRVYTDNDEWIAVIEAGGDATFNSLTSNNDVVVKGNLEVQGTTITVDSATAQTIDLGDNDKIRFGDGDDLQIYHDGTDSYIANTTGTLKLSGNTDVTGNITVSGTVDGRDIAADGTTLDAVASTYVDVSGDTLTGDLAFGDNVKAKFGASDDLQIYHDGSASVISEQGTGSLIVKTSAFSLQNAAGSEFMGIASENSGVYLYFDGSQKLQTTSSGVDITGTVVADGLTVDGAGTTRLSVTNTTTGVTGLFGVDSNGLSIASTNASQLSIGLGGPRLKVENSGDISFYEDTGTTAKLTWDASAEELQFKDNVAAEFGDGGDLRIYHSGTNSYIADASGTGFINIRSNAVRLASADGSEILADFIQNGAVSLYYDNSAKLATTSTGIDVTGTVTADGLAVDGNGTFQSNSGTSSPTLTIKDTDTASVNGQVIGILNFDNSDIDYAGTKVSLQAINDSANLGRGSLKINTAWAGTINTALQVGFGNDISFYSEDSTSQDFYWDASTSRLGLGTTSPAVTLEVNGGIRASATVSLYDTGSTGNYLSFVDSVWQGAIYHDSGDMYIRSGGTSSSQNRFRVRGNGDISFYDSSVTSEDFYWDASTSRLGIGTTSPSTALDVNGTITSTGATINGMDVGVANGATRYINTHSDAGRLSLHGGASQTGASLYLSGPSFGAGNEAELVASNNVKFVTGGSEAMRIDSSGNVGIGTTSPSQLVHLNGGVIRVQQTNYADYKSNQLYVNSGGYEFAVNGNIEFSDQSNNTVMTVDNANDRVGIGTTSPDDALQVVGGNIIIGEPDENVNRTLTIHGSNTSNKTATLSLQDYIFRIDGGNPNQALELGNSSGSVYGSQTYTINSNFNPSFFKWVVDSTEVMRVTEDGNVGIGTTSPSFKLDVQGTDDFGARFYSSDATSYVSFQDNSTTDSTSVFCGAAGNHFLVNGKTATRFLINASEAARIDSSGSFLVGKTAAGVANEGFEVNSNDYVAISKTSFSPLILNRKSTDGTIVDLRINNNTIGSIGNSGTLTYLDGNTGLIFKEGGTEAARIDSSGNLLVGTTDAYPPNNTGSNNGAVVSEVGAFFASRESQASLVLNRTTSDGDIAQFNKDGTTVGSIGVDNSDNLVIEGNSTHSGLQFGTATIMPHQNGAVIDNTVDLGYFSHRFKDLYLSGGVYLGGTGADNLLDDYEEGIFAAQFNNEAGDLSATSSLNFNRVARYRKIGSVVYITVVLSTSGTITGTASSPVVITGLPFTSDQSSNFSICNVSPDDSTSYASMSVIPKSLQIGHNVTYGTLFKEGTNDDIPVLTSDLAASGNANRIHITGFYFAS